MQEKLIPNKVCKAYVEGGDGAGGVAGDELDLHADMSE